VGGWGVTGEVVVTVFDITVEEWFISVVEAWWGGSAEQGGQTHVTPEKHEPENGSTEPGAGGMDPPLAATALD